MKVKDLVRVLGEFGADPGPSLEAPVIGEDDQVIPVPWPGRIDREGRPTDIYHLDPDVLAPGGRVGDVVGERPEDGQFGGDAEWGVHACAWYRSLSHHGQGWGIYIRQDCLLDRARRLAPWVHEKGTVLDAGRIEQLIRSAYIWLFLHEQFHHKVESFAIRLLIGERRAVFASYWSAVYAPAMGTDRQLEEALANADAYRRLDESTYKGVIGAAGVTGLRAYLRHRFPRSLPGYRLASRYLSEDKFAAAEALLQAQIHEAMSKPAPGHKRWHFATHMIRALLPITGYVAVVVPAGSTSIIVHRGRGSSASAPATFQYLSVSTREVERVLAAQGFKLQGDRGKGSHTVWGRDGGPSITVPSQRDLTPGVLHKIARGAGFLNGHHLAIAARGR